MTDRRVRQHATSDCTTANTDPITSDNAASTQMTGRQSSRWNGRAITSTRSTAANAAALPTEAMNAVTLVGEPSYTSGVHTWNGTAATLNPRPTISSAIPARTNESLPSIRTEVWKYSTISLMLVVCVPP
jgi:hypothetical protein